MDFYKRLGIVCRAVPEGKVITYGQAALLCGYPKNARQVGYGLKKELAGDVPAYKVVNSQGVLSGAASFEHPGLQRILLEEEGIEVSMDNKVDLKKYGWKIPWKMQNFSGKHFAGRGSSYLKFFFLLGRYTYRHLCALSGNTGERQAVSAAVQAFKTQVGIGYAYMAGRGAYGCLGAFI